MSIKTYQLNHSLKISRCREKDLPDIGQTYPYKRVLILAPIQNAVVRVSNILIVDRDVALIRQEI